MQIAFSLAPLGVWISAFAAGVVTSWTLEFFLWWGFFGLWSIIGLIFFEKYWPTIVALIATATLLFLTGTLHPLVYLAEHPWKIAFWVLGYLALGFVWVVFRWVRFIEQMRPKREKVIKDFLKSGFSQLVADESEVEKGKRDDYSRRKVLAADAETWKQSLLANGMAPDKPEELTAALTNVLQSKVDYRNRVDLGTATAAPIWVAHKAEYAEYFFAWPLDFLSYFFQDVLRDVWDAVSHFVEGIFNSYSRKRMIKPIQFKE